ncbi:MULTISPECIES: hypothetical protein [unclassified Fusibacter]|uniref:hypothetical protein n=1 Tax=unclassified Fusibacter TaxID=2624464 RepID=UPI0010111BC6|nr:MULTISPECIES: hypothetical protein [unclassified Fusibacter]MCK8061199.1 hypothetical protein [Fusibacter sp. A2]NPE23457.1 hypothetical protein [Fusibacter sp. A1]RXV59235.1 hypothetical protein DWB64_16695 [Fusibacter sp. A1]
MKRFGLCGKCIKSYGKTEKDLLNQSKLVLEKRVFEVSENKIKSKYLKCRDCKTLKAARLGFKEFKAETPSQVSELLSQLALEKDQPPRRVEEVAGWLKRESVTIETQGLDYWIDEGVLYFRATDGSCEIKLNDQSYDAYSLYSLLS